MGKGVELTGKNKEKIYPITASDLVYDKDTKKNIKTSLSEKVEEAPKDGSKYYRQNGVWVKVDESIDPAFPILMINLTSDRGSDDMIERLKFIVKYASVVTELESGQRINVPYGARLIVEFPSVEGYNKPDDIVVEDVSGNVVRNAVYEYTVTEVNVYVSAEDGTPVDGQIVTVKEAHRPENIENGVYIESTEGVLFDIDSWIGDATANSVVLFDDNFKVKIPFYSNALTGGSDFELPNIGTNDLETALSDMDGEDNSSHGDDYVFPNGDVGAYVPSLGELSIIQKYWEKIVLAFAKTGNELNGSTLESSTATSNYGYVGFAAWEMNMITGESSRNSYYTLMYIRKVSSDEVFKFQKRNEYEVLGGRVSFTATKNNEVVVSINGKTGYYITPDSIKFIAEIGTKNVSFLYHKNLVTTIRINQTITDPDTMITRIVDEGGIEAVRANSHRYTGKLNAEGVMELKQLDDNDSTKYVDGTNADITTFGTDVWMKLPQFFWKCEEYETDVWDFSVSYGSRPDDTYKEWDGKDMIGAYKIAATNLKLYSVSGKDVYDAVSLETLITYSKKREDGFSLIKWKHHCMMAMLFYTYYGTTKSDSTLGHGSGSTKQVTGVTNNLGMNDTLKLDSAEWDIQNFWGLENWFTEHSELIGDVRLTQTSWTIEGRDSISPTIPSSSNGFHSKMKFGEYIDMFPTELNGTSSTGFASYSSSPKGDVIVRSISGGDNYSMTTINMNLYLTSKNGVSSRISYYGDYIIKE